MTDSPPKPKRRRWQWLVAGIILIVVSVECWWLWPRGDGRFVGKWNVFINGIGPFSTIELRRNGWAANLGVDGRPTFYFRWRVRDGIFSTGEADGSLSHHVTQVLSPVVGLTGRRLSAVFEELPIMSVEQDTIVLGKPNGLSDSAKLLSRVSE